MRQPAQAPVEPPSGDVLAGPAAGGRHAAGSEDEGPADEEGAADGPGRAPEDLELPVRHRRVQAPPPVRPADDPELLESILAGLLNLP
jgi:hypothetical protein